MLDIAAFKGIRGKVDVVAWKDFSSAFEKAKHSGKSVVLDFQHWCRKIYRFYFLLSIKDIQFLIFLKKVWIDDFN